MNLQEAKQTNTFGIKYLSKGHNGRRYAIKIEIGCVNGKHGKMEYFYEGNDYELAVWFANKVNKLITEGGHTKALDWREYDMAEEVREWQTRRK